MIPVEVCINLIVLPVVQTAGRGRDRIETNFMPTRLMPPLFVLLWSTGFIGARYAMPYAEPLTFLALRFALAVVVLVGLIFALSSKRLNAREIGVGMVTGILIHGLYLGGVFWAVHRGLPAGITALIAGLQPLITTLIALAVLGEKVSSRQWLGMTLGLVGVIVVLSPKLGVSGAGVNAATLTASAIAVLSISAGTVWQKRYGVKADPVSNATWQYVGAAIVTGLGSILFETREVIWNGELVFALLWLTLVLSIGAIFLLMHMIRQGEMAKVSSLFYLVPVVTALMAWLLFDEKLLPIQLVGMAIATLGVALATVRRA